MFNFNVTGIHTPAIPARATAVVMTGRFVVRKKCGYQSEKET